MNSKVQNHEIVILGGGISGLATAWFLHKAGIPFKLFEKEPDTGGVIRSELHSDSVMDFGPNSLRDQNGTLRELAEELGLKDDVIQISEAFKTRFIVRDGKLQTLRPALGSLISTKILSGKGKLRLLKEPFVSKGKSEDESVGSFLEKRVGKEAVDYLADPVFSGIYAGDIYMMSKQIILPKLAEFEHEFGSILWGAIRSKKEKDKNPVKPKVLSFRKGIQELTDCITEKLSDDILQEELIGIRKSDEGFEIQTTQEQFKARSVISCIPAYNLARILEGFDPKLSALLTDIDYAPMLSTQLIFDKEAFNSIDAGFGFLIPRKENLRLLGAIWKSSIFPELTSDGKAHFTLMTGGAHDRNILSDPIEETEQQILGEFSSIMEISEKPEVVKSRLWKKAIPQFEVGFTKVREQLHAAEQEYPGLYIGGNYMWGVSVPDCIEGARKFAEELKF